METKFKDVAHLYVGCKLSNGEYLTHAVCDFFATDSPVMVALIDGHKEVKPILYTLSAMTEEQKNRLNEIERNGTSYPTMAYALAPVFAYMLSQHFDLFGLIESGQAIDATNTPSK